MIGPRNAILVINDLVLGGLLLGLLAAAFKWLVERSKVAQYRGRLWGRLFWDFAHFVMDIECRVRGFLRRRWLRGAKNISPKLA